MYFAPVIFKKFLASNDAIVANLAVAVVNFLATFIALYLVDKAGRSVAVPHTTRTKLAYTAPWCCCEVHMIMATIQPADDVKPLLFWYHSYRRVLLVAGGLGMAFFTGCFAVATSDFFDYRNDKNIAYVIIACTALYVLNFAYSWGPLGWVVRKAGPCLLAATLGPDARTHSTLDQSSCRTIACICTS
jgi:hypothetical protein